MVTRNRLFYPVTAVGIAPDGGTTYTRLKGLRSCGITTRFNLEHIFELGQIAEYEAVENTPDVEMTIEKSLDGAPLVYHSATQQATDPSLVGRSAARCTVAVSFFTETQNSASGTPLSQVYMSGMFTSSLTYNFPTQGGFTEAVTMAGNHKQWLSSGFTFTGGFTNTDTPPSGIQKRQNFRLGSGTIYCVLPTDLPGVNSQGYCVPNADGSFPIHIQNARISTNLGRTPLYELGRYIPYFRTVDFPVEVRTDFEIMSLIGDQKSCTEAGNNVTANQITLKIEDGTSFDMGAANKCMSISDTGGNAQIGGGSRTLAFSYVNYSTCTVTAPHDPAAL
jgi:hypothetical protein